MGLQREIQYPPTPLRVLQQNEIQNEKILSSPKPTNAIG